MLHLSDVSLYYEIHGAGEPILFLHGLGGACRDWEPQRRRFESSYLVIAHDVCGHGQSTKPPGPYSLAQFGRHTAELIRRVVGKPVHVVGLSMGGMIAFQLAADHPELVRSLVIVNSGPEMVVRTFKERMGIVQRRVIVRLLGMRKMGEVLAEKLLPGAEHSARRGLFADRWARNDKGAYLRALSALVGWTVTAKLPAIRQPVLVVTADQDYTPVAWKQWYTSLMPNATLTVIPESRHMMPIERPQLFHDALLPFLAGAGRGSEVAR